MNCEEARQSAAAYALGVLTEEEQAAFERHIAECDADHGLSSLIRTAERLAEAAPEMEPPAGLRARIMAVAATETQARTIRLNPAPTATSPAAVTYLAPSTRSGVAARARRAGIAAYGMAASAVIVIAALVAWNLFLQLREDDPVQLRHFYSESDGDWLRVEAGLGQPGLTLAVGGLDTLEGNDAYQFWAIRGSDWLHIGDFNTNPEGRWAGDFDFALEAGDYIAITSGPLADNGWPAADPEIQTRI